MESGFQHFVFHCKMINSPAQRFSLPRDRMKTINLFGDHRVGSPAGTKAYSIPSSAAREAAG
jgi:hypothetical protein